MNLTFLIAGFGFVAVAGILYYFTSKAEEEEVEVREEKAPAVSAPVHEVINIINFHKVYLLNLLG